MEFPFFFNTYSILSLYFAVFLDMLLGDGNSPYHPIRLMGALISYCEKRARASAFSLKTSGTIMALSLVVLTFVVFSLLSYVLNLVSVLIFIIFSSTVIYFSLCLKCLAEEAKKVYLLLKDGSIEEARRQLSYLVSRDTSYMDESEISRSVIETVSENLVDGIFSPFFYAAIGGPAFAMAFKMASTLDSMVGYKTDRYRELGYFSARLDDFLNFLPARLSVFFILLAAFLLFKKNPKCLFRQVRYYSQFSESPNSGYPEAAFALALGIRLGGPTKYCGQIKELPFINKDGRRTCGEDIINSIKLLYGASFLFYLLPIIFYFFLCLT